MEREDIDAALDKIYKTAENLDKRVRDIEGAMYRTEKAVPLRLMPALRSTFFIFSRNKLYLLMMFTIVLSVGIGYFTLFFIVGLKPVFDMPEQAYSLLLSILFAVLIGIPLSLMLYEFKNRSVVKGAMTSAAGGALAGGGAAITSVGGTTLGSTGSTLVGSCASMFGASAVSLSGSASSVAASGISAAIGLVIGPVLMAVALIISYASFNKSVKDFYRRHR